MTETAKLTQDLDVEWFDHDIDILGVVACRGCGAIVLRGQRERHWHFHIQTTGNIHR